MIKRSVQKSVRFPAEIHQYIQREANANERSFKQQLVFLVKKAIASSARKGR